MDINEGSLTNIESQAGLKFAGGSLGEVVSRITPYIFAAVGILLVFYFLSGGFKLMTSGGDPKKIEGGKKIIVNALIGFIIIFTAYWLVQIILSFLGIAGASPLNGALQKGKVFLKGK